MNAKKVLLVVCAGLLTSTTVMAASLGDVCNALAGESHFAIQMACTMYINSTENSGKNYNPAKLQNCVNTANAEKNNPNATFTSVEACISSSAE